MVSKEGAKERTTIKQKNGRTEEGNFRQQADLSHFPKNVQKEKHIFISIDISLKHIV